MKCRWSDEFSECVHVCECVCVENEASAANFALKPFFKLIKCKFA